MEKEEKELNGNQNRYLCVHLYTCADTQMWHITHSPTKRENDTFVRLHKIELILSNLTSDI